MLITIPTFGRWWNQRTLHNLPPSIRQKVWLVVQERDSDNWRKSPVADQNAIILPPHIQDIASTRDYIIEQALLQDEDRVVMLDDDLDFARRRTDDPTKFRPANEDDMELLFKMIEYHLDDYAHVGVSSREGANRNPENYLYNTRMMRVLAYAPKVLAHHGIRFAKGPGLMEDFRVTLDLLTRGYRNIILNSWVHNQCGSNQSGGCSDFRTWERQKQAAIALAESYPDFVTVVQKPSKNWGKGEEFENGRYDVRVRWKDAYNSSGARRTPKILD